MRVERYSFFWSIPRITNILLMQHINTGFCHGVSTMCPSVT
jgi:hypothetical protein